MNEIYLDYNASAPLDKRVLEKMRPVLEDRFGNASSSHSFGRRLNAMVDEARHQVASLVGGNPNSVIFTAGATEANNHALRGIFNDHATKPSRLLTSAVEHASVRNTAKWLGDFQGADITVIPVTTGGYIDLGIFKSTLDTNVKLVSVMGANSETGVFNPIEELSSFAEKYGFLVHCDATQLVGRKIFDMEELGVDLVSLSSHKIYGPGGMGALVVTRDVRKTLEPLLFGGGHENGLRSGSLNVAGIVGFGAAAELAENELASEMKRLATLRDFLVAQLRNLITGVEELGDISKRVANTANLRFIGADADAVMANMRDVAVSNGSACSSGAIEPSLVLQAMGLDRIAASEALRFSLGRFTKKEEIDAAIPRIVTAVQYVRSMTENVSGNGIS